MVFALARALTNFAGSRHATPVAGMVRSMCRAFNHPFREVPKFAGFALPYGVVIDSSRRTGEDAQADMLGLIGGRFGLRHRAIFRRVSSLHIADLG